MKSADFSNMFLNASTTTIALASLLVCYSLSASADAPPPESFNKSSELVLTLSDQWLQPDKQASFKTQNGSDSNKIITDKLKKRPVKVDCGMDVNQNAGIDNSLSNRLTGECELHYSY